MELMDCALALVPAANNAGASNVTPIAGCKFSRARSRNWYVLACRAAARSCLMRRLTIRAPGIDMPPHELPHENQNH